MASSLVSNTSAKREMIKGFNTGKDESDKESTPKQTRKKVITDSPKYQKKVIHDESDDEDQFDRAERNSSVRHSADLEFENVKQPTKPSRAKSPVINPHQRAESPDLP